MNPNEENRPIQQNEVFAKRLKISDRKASHPRMTNNTSSSMDDEAYQIQLVPEDTDSSIFGDNPAQPVGQDIVMSDALLEPTPPRTPSPDALPAMPSPLTTSIIPSPSSLQQTIATHQDVPYDDLLTICQEVAEARNQALSDCERFSLPHAQQIIRLLAAENQRQRPLTRPISEEIQHLRGELDQDQRQAALDSYPLAAGKGFDTPSSLQTDHGKPGVFEHEIDESSKITAEAAGMASIKRAIREQETPSTPTGQVDQQPGQTSPQHMQSFKLTQGVLLPSQSPSADPTHSAVIQSHGSQDAFRPSNTLFRSIVESSKSREPAENRKPESETQPGYPAADPLLGKSTQKRTRARFNGVSIMRIPEASGLDQHKEEQSQYPSQKLLQARLPRRTLLPSPVLVQKSVQRQDQDRAPASISVAVSQRLGQDTSTQLLRQTSQPPGLLPAPGLASTDRSISEAGLDSTEAFDRPRRTRLRARFALDGGEGRSEIEDGGSGSAGVSERGARRRSSSSSSSSSKGGNDNVTVKRNAFGNIEFGFGRSVDVHNTLNPNQSCQERQENGLLSQNELEELERSDQSLKRVKNRAQRLGERFRGPKKELERSNSVTMSASKPGPLPIRRGRSLNLNGSASASGPDTSSQRARGLVSSTKSPVAGPGADSQRARDGGYNPASRSSNDDKTARGSVLNPAPSISHCPHCGRDRGTVLHFDFCLHCFKGLNDNERGGDERDWDSVYDDADAEAAMLCDSSLNSRDITESGRSRGRSRSVRSLNVPGSVLAGVLAGQQAARLETSGLKQVRLGVAESIEPYSLLIPGISGSRSRSRSSSSSSSKYKSDQQLSSRAYRIKYNHKGKRKDAEHGRPTDITARISETRAQTRSRRPALGAEDQKKPVRTEAEMWQRFEALREQMQRERIERENREPVIGPAGGFAQYVSPMTASTLNNMKTMLKTARTMGVTPRELVVPEVPKYHYDREK